MAEPSRQLISVVVPVYNEAEVLAKFHQSLLHVLQQAPKVLQFEIIYCDDGSTDVTAATIQRFHKEDQRVKLVKLSRNFGKESALTAGIAMASGAAIVSLDGDGQHPVEALPAFIAAWRQGAQVVIGLRRQAQPDSRGKRAASWLFYRAFNRLTDQTLRAGATDFRLIDRSVQQALLQLHESDTMTRGLIDWLGFKRTFVPITLKAREHGTASYSYQKMFRLSVNTFLSLSTVPLYLFGCLGILITGGAFLLGGAVIIEQLVLGDPWHWKFTGTAMLSILLLFLVGIVLMSQGMLSLYVSHIHSQTKQRPLYVIDYDNSAGLKA